MCIRDSGYILLAQRRQVKLVNETAANGWAPMYYSDGIRFKTIGLIGFGIDVYKRQERS